MAYKFASNDFGVSPSASDWSVKTAAGGATVGGVTIDPVRGAKYTIVALPASATDSSVCLIMDPYNKSLGSDSIEVEGGTYQVTRRIASTKTVLFKGRLSIDKNADVLLPSVPDAASAGAIKALAKIEGRAGANEIPSL